MNRPETTLFMLTSVDGKICTGDNDLLDVDKDYKNTVGLKEGLQQYYDLEQETDLFSLSTGRVFAKIGINEKIDTPEKTPVSFIVIDNKPHLNHQGVSYLAKKSHTLIVATNNPRHPAYELSKEFDNIKIISYSDLGNLFTKLKTDHSIDGLTVQSGGTLNTELIRNGLIDRVLLVVAPALVGGKNTSTLADGESLHNQNDLFKIKTLELIRAKPLEYSYLLLEYKVKN